MSMSAQYNGQPEPRVKTVYYAGTDTIEPGYALCYTHDATVANADPKLRKGVQVSKPATANLMLFAGIARQRVAGPGWVEVSTPDRGETVTALVKANATAQTTALSAGNGEWGLIAHADATLNMPLVATALETADSSTTAANKRVLFR